MATDTAAGLAYLESIQYTHQYITLIKIYSFMLQTIGCLATGPIDWLALAPIGCIAMGPMATLLWAP